MITDIYYLGLKLHPIEKIMELTYFTYKILSFFDCSLLFYFCIAKGNGDNIYNPPWKFLKEHINTHLLICPSCSLREHSNCASAIYSFLDIYYLGSKTETIEKIMELTCFTYKILNFMIVLYCFTFVLPLATGIIFVTLLGSF